MKKHLFFLALLSSLYLHAQTTAIPDPAFEQALINLGIDSDGTVNGQVLNSDIIDVHNLDVSGNFIQDLTGIESFIHLDTLICSYNFIPQIDFSANTQLKYLDVYEAGLQSLDVSALSLLEILKCSNEIHPDYACSNCFNNINTLDLSNNYNLRELYSNANGLTNVIFPVSNNLIYVEMQANGFQQLNLCNIPELKYLIVGLNNFQSLDLSCVPHLKYLDVNKSNLTNIDLSQNMELETLFLGYFYVPWEGIQEYGNDNNLPNLDVNNLQHLKFLFARKIGLTQIDLSQNTELEKLYISKNELYNIDVTHNINLLELDVKDCYLTDIDLSNNTLLTKLCLNHYDYLGNTIIFPNNFSSVDLSHNLELIVLKVGAINLNNLDVSYNTHLKILSAYENNLTTLDLKNNTELLSISVFDNQLTELDVSINTQLQTISISSNPITSFNIINNPEVKHLYCINDSLQHLNLKNNHNYLLEKLIATGNSSLTCIQVDDVSYAENAQGWQKDPGAVYSTDCSTQDIDEYENAGIEIYPNPAIDRLFIDNYTTQEIKQIQIFNISGKIVLQTEFTGDYIDIQSLQRGVYVLKIQVGEQWVTHKLMKE